MEKYKATTYVLEFLPVIGKHGNCIDVVKATEAFPFKTRPNISNQDLNTFKDGH